LIDDVIVNQRRSMQLAVRPEKSTYTFHTYELLIPKQLAIRRISPLAVEDSRAALSTSYAAIEHLIFLVDR